MGKHTGTPATSFLAQQGVSYTEHVYEYVEHGGKDFDEVEDLIAFIKSAKVDTQP